MKEFKTLIIPDVHGRDFWKIPVKETLENSDAHIVFLGDYHDPYMYEWASDLEDEFSEEVIKRNREVLSHSIENLKEIISLKKDNPNRITLLIGNHDCGYAISTDICSSRYDRRNAAELVSLFNDNRNLFQLADETTINGKHFIFSHAGISKQYAERCFGDEVNEDNVVDLFNNAYLTDNYGIMDSLGIYDRYRGWYGSDYASLVWADVREWFDDEESLKDEEYVSHKQEGYGYLVFGHSQLREDPIIKENVADLDCRRAFVIDNEGNIKEFLEFRE